MAKTKQRKHQPQDLTSDGWVDALLSSLRGLLARLRESARPENLEILGYIEMSSQATAHFLKHSPQLPACAEKIIQMHLFLLTHGQLYTPAVRPNRFKKSKAGECFANAQRLAMDNDRLYYCEGLAMVEGVPLVTEHGWCCTEDGSVVDVTWDEGVAYLGVPFQRHFVASTALAERGFSPLLPRVFALELPEEEWKHGG